MSFWFFICETCEKNLEILSTTRLYKCPRWQRGNEKFASNFHFLVCKNNNSATILMMMYVVLLRLLASSLVLLRLAELVSQVSRQDACMLRAAILNDERKRFIYSTCVVYRNILIQNLTTFTHLNLLTQIWSLLIDHCYLNGLLYFSPFPSLSCSHTNSHSYTQTHSLNTTSAPSAAPLSYLTWPENVSVAVGEPAVFRCGVAESSPNVTFRFYGSHGNYSITCPYGQVEDIPQVSCLTLLKGLMRFVAFKSGFFTFCFSSQALYGTCKVKNGELVASWTLKGTSLSDNGTKVTCQGSEGTEAPAAILHVYGKDSVTFQNRVFQILGIGEDLKKKQKNKTPINTLHWLSHLDNGTNFSILIGCVIGGFFGTLLVAGLAYLMLQNSESVRNFLSKYLCLSLIMSLLTKAHSP